MCDPRGSSFILPHRSSVFYGFLPALSFWIAAAIRYAIRSTIRLPGSELTVFRRRKAFLLCKNPCGGTAVGMGSPPQSGIAAPAQRNFQRKFALRQVGSARFVVPLTSSRSKVRNNARLVTCPCRAAPGCQRDRGPFCFGKSPEEPLPRGSFGQLLRGGSTPRFFSQIRSVGAKNGPAGRVLPENHTPRYPFSTRRVFSTPST